MSTSRQKITTPITNDPRLKMVQRVTRLMDEQFSVGGFRFGLDPILNLVPVAGDVSSYMISVALIITMVKHGASGRVAAKMLANATLDALVGAIPVLGWIFDFSFKANTRNLQLLTEYYTEGKHRGSAKPVIVSILIVMLLVLVLIVFLVIRLFQWLEHLISS